MFSDDHDEDWFDETTRTHGIPQKVCLPSVLTRFLFLLLINFQLYFDYILFHRILNLVTFNYILSSENLISRPSGALKVSKL